MHVKQKFTVWFATFALLVLLFSFSSCSTNESTLKIRPTSYDFGIVSLYETESKKFALINKTGSSVKILSCNIIGAESQYFVLTQGYVPNTEIRKNGTNRIEVKFYPLTEGQKSAQIILKYSKSNATSQNSIKTITIPVSGECKKLPNIVVSSSVYTFPNTTIGFFNEVEITITNTGLSEAIISNISIKTKPPFEIIDGWEGTGINIAPDWSKKIKVQFKPTKLKVYKGKITIKHNGKNSPTVINIEGEGIASSSAAIHYVPQYDFGMVGIGNTATHDFIIENTGSANLILNQINIVNNEKFYKATFIGSVPITINPRAIYTITIQFNPIMIGNFPTVIEIMHNAPNIVSPAFINILGVGDTGRIELSEYSPWNFGSVILGYSTIQEVEIMNTAGIDLNIHNIALTSRTAFKIDSVKDSSGNLITTTPFTIPPGDYATIAIKFSPNTVGDIYDTLLITNDGGYAPSPATLNLTGTGRN